MISMHTGMPSCNTLFYILVSVNYRREDFDFHRKRFDAYFVCTQHIFTAKVTPINSYIHAAAALI